MLISNPKALILFVALFPQFIDPGGGYVCRSANFNTANVNRANVNREGPFGGKAGAALSRGRVRLLSRASGLCLIGGGAWLALARGR